MTQENIRLATIEDAPAIAALVEQAYTPWIAVVGRRPRPMDDKYESRCVEGHVWLLEVDGELAGVVVIEEIGGALFLHNVAISPQEQHRGLGRLLMGFIEQEALRRGLSEVELTTSVTMQRNVNLYQSLGYTITGVEPTSTVDRLLMSKHLSGLQADGRPV